MEGLVHLPRKMIQNHLGLPWGTWPMSSDCDCSRWIAPGHRKPPLQRWTCSIGEMLDLVECRDRGIEASGWFHGVYSGPIPPGLPHIYSNLHWEPDDYFEVPYFQTNPPESGCVLLFGCFPTQLLAVVVGNFCANCQTVKPAPEAAHALKKKTFQSKLTPAVGKSASLTDRWAHLLPKFVASERSPHKILFADFPMAHLNSLCQNLLSLISWSFFYLVLHDCMTHVFDHILPIPPGTHMINFEQLARQAAPWAIRPRILWDPLHFQSAQGLSKGLGQDHSQTV